MDRADLLRRVLDRLNADPGVVAVLDYGSGAEGRTDALSDLDLVVYVPDAETAARTMDFASLARSIGPSGDPPPLTYHAGDPTSAQCRAVFDAVPLPLRLDLTYFGVSRLADVTGFSTRPVSRAAMLLLDRTGSDALARDIDRLTSRPRPVPAPHDAAHLFGDAIYYLLRVEALRRRGEPLAARTEFHWLVLGSLAGLARLEAGTPGRWKTSLAVVGVGTDCPVRAADLARCVPGPTDDDLRRACMTALDLALSLHAALASRFDLPAPDVATRRLRDALTTR